MTTADWAAVLAATQDPLEVRDTLLVLADELPEGAAAQLRSWAVRRDGLAPTAKQYENNDLYVWWTSETWSAEYGHRPDNSDCLTSVVPDQVIRKMCSDHPKWFREKRNNFRVFTSVRQAWEALLGYLEKQP